MSPHQEQNFLDEQEQSALRAMRRPEEWGAIPGAVPSTGKLLSTCCNAEELGGIWIKGDERTGTCSRCGADAIFTERPL